MKNKPNNQVDTIGSRIKTAREEKGLSQLQLAEELGFKSATAISLIESDDRRVPAAILQLLGEVLHKDIKYFLGQEHALVDVQVALRADKDLTDEYKDVISRFINLAKNKNKDEGK